MTINLVTFSEKSLTLKEVLSSRLLNELNKCACICNLVLFFIFLTLPGRLCISVLSLLAQACQALLLQPTDRGGLSGSKLPRTVEGITVQKREVTELSPKWFCNFFHNINKSRFLGLQICPCNRVFPLILLVPLSQSDCQAHSFLFFVFGYVGSSFLCEGFLQLRQAGASHYRGLSLRSTGSRRAGSVIVAHGPSRSAACGIFPDQGSNPCKHIVLRELLAFGLGNPNNAASQRKKVFHSYRDLYNF